MEWFYWKIKCLPSTEKIKNTDQAVRKCIERKSITYYTIYFETKKQVKIKQLKLFQTDHIRLYKKDKTIKTKSEREVVRKLGE